MSPEDKQSQDKAIDAKKPQKSSQGKSKEKKESGIKVKGLIGSFFVESIMIDGKPAFAYYDYTTKRIGVCDNIQYENTIYLPWDKESYGYEPYTFTNDEIKELASTEITKESLLDEIKEIVEEHLYAKEEIKYLVIGDILLTYCLEWISTLHYIFAVGETGSGKSTLTYLFKIFGYRCMYGANIPYANIYNFLGKDEEGTGTIAEDEAGDISFQRDKIRLYKNSYFKGNKLPVVDMNNGRKQLFYCTFGFKVFSGERLPFDKGFLERLAICFMMQGIPKKNIKKPSVEDVERFRKLRNKIIVWKLQNIEKGLGNTLSREVGRDEELYEDYLKIMSGTKYEEYGEKAVAYFVGQRHDRIWNSTEANIFRLVLKVIKANNEVIFQDLWNAFLEGSEITVEQDKGSYVDRDTGQRITQNFLAKILEEKFRGTKTVSIEFYKDRDGKQKQKRVTSYLLDEKDLVELSKKYNIESDNVQDQN